MSEPRPTGGPRRPPERRPSRRGRGPGPWIVLAVIALVPVVALVALRSWSLGQDDANQAAPVPDPAAVVPTPTPALSTGFTSLRRLPTIISREVNTDAFASEVSPFLASVNDRSCGGVSVDGQLIGERNAQLAVIPASNQKIPVAAVALERLGADFRYTTTVMAITAPQGGVIDGDLYLVGGGDPLLSSDWYPASNLELNPVTSPTSFDTLADRVVAAGVTQITGAVLGDGSRYDDEYFAPGWGDGVAGLEGGPYDALMANDSRVLGDPLRGNNPNEAAAREFTLLLEARGVAVGASASTGTAPVDAVMVTSIDSAPLSDVVAEMLGNSDNNTAEMVVKELGFTVGAPGTREAGLGLVREQLVRVGCGRHRDRPGRRLGPEPRQPPHLRVDPDRAATQWVRVTRRPGTAGGRPDRHAGDGLRRPSRRRAPARQDRHAQQPAVQRRSAGGEGPGRFPARRGWECRRVRVDPQRPDRVGSERVPPGVERPRRRPGHLSGGCLPGGGGSPVNPYEPTPFEPIPFDLAEVPEPAEVGVTLRYRRGPLLGLLVMALVPLAALTGLLMWSDTQADEHEAAEAAGQIEAPAVEQVAEPAPALTTSMATYRRVPAALADLGADNELAIAMEQLAVFVDDRSCLAVSVNGRAVSSWNGDVAVIPASTMKVLVAGAAIEVLGADSRFTTSVASPQAVDGVVDGDVYLVGGGDPLLVAGGFPLDDDAPDPAATTSLDELADALVGAGITSIRGSVVGDATRYDDQYVNPTWGAGVAFVDAGPIGGLVVNDGRTVGRSGRQPDPGEAAAREFARLLRERGVSIAGGWESGVVEPGTPVVASVESAPLSSIVADMLSRSDNDTAEMLVKEIGVVTGAVGTTPAGLQVLESTVRSWGVPMDNTVLVDGSGLSANNRLTCDTLVGVLDHLADTPAVVGLAVAGRTGTLIDEFLGSPVEGRLIAKTGTLSNPPADADPPEVKALAGYLEATNGDLLEFAIVLNGPGYVTTDGYLGYWSALAERLAAHPTGPDTALLGPR